jgi:DNA-damage-inducible protein J
MASTVPVQTRVDASVKERAGVVLDKMGLTVSDVVRIVLTRIANEGALPAGLTTDAATHDAWFRAKVQEALDDTRPDIPHAEVRATMAKVRADALGRRTGDG